MVKTLRAGLFRPTLEGMTPPSHLASIRTLGDIRRERPRQSGETEDQYYQRLATELHRRQRGTQRHGLVARVLRRDARR